MRGGIRRCFKESFIIKSLARVGLTIADAICIRFFLAIVIIKKILNRDEL